MAEQFEKDFDDILNDILTDYTNLDNQPDTSVGSTAWVIASVLASMVWGLYRYQDYISRQHFPDTADSENLNHWGSIYNVTREDDDTDATYLAKVLAFIRQPPAGGNALDYENWALDNDNSFYYDIGTDATYYNAFATVQDVDGGVLGAVGVYTIPTDEDTIPLAAQQALRGVTEDYIGTVRPLGILSASVYDSTASVQTIAINVSSDDDSDIDTDLIETEVINELATFKPGQTLWKSTLIGVSLNFGADSAVVTTPSDETTTTSNLGYFRANAGSVTITQI